MNMSLSELLEILLVENESGVYLQATERIAISSRDMVRGTSPVRSLGSSDGASNGTRVTALDARRPRWTSWQVMSAPNAWTWSARARKGGIMETSQLLMLPVPPGDVGCTLVGPKT